MFDPAHWKKLRRRCGQLTKVHPALSVGSRLLKVRFVAYDIVPPAFHFTPHEHSFHELIVVLEGSAVFTVNEKAQHIERGHTFLFSPQTRHGWRVLDKACVMFVVAFSLEPSVAIPFPESWPICRELVEKIDGFSHTLTQTGTCDLLCLSSRLLSVISEALANFAPETLAPIPRGEHPDLPEVIKQLLVRDLSRPLTLSDISAHTGISVRQLTHQFRRLAGETIVAYIQELRLFHARSLLRETDEKIAEISVRVGIQSQRHFYACFRRYFGMTPHEYRLMTRKEKG